MKKQIAVLAEEGLQLDALLQAWEESSILQLYTPLLLSTRDSGNTALFRNRPLLLNALDEVNIADLALVLVLNADREAKAWLATVSCPVLADASVLAGLDAQMAGYAQTGKLQVPQAISLALKALLAGQSCQAISATVMMPASSFGKRGVDELAAQTVRLLNAQAVNKRVFDRQLTFNSFPYAKAAAAEQLLAEWKALLNVEQCHVAMLQLPVFHGVAAQLTLEMADEKAVQQWLDHVKTTDALVEPDEPVDCSILSAVQLDGDIQVANIQVSSVNPCRIDLWIAFDDVQLSVRKGLIVEAELLIKHDL